MSQPKNVKHDTRQSAGFVVQSLNQNRMGSIFHSGATAAEEAEEDSDTAEKSSGNKKLPTLLEDSTTADAQQRQEDRDEDENSPSKIQDQIHVLQKGKKQTGRKTVKRMSVEEVRQKLLKKEKNQGSRHANTNKGKSQKAKIERNRRARILGIDVLLLTGARGCVCVGFRFRFRGRPVDVDHSPGGRTCSEILRSLAHSV